jgi:hypothetical protein
MKWVYVLVEGETEETFVDEVLNHHLESFEVYLKPILIETSEGLRKKGGYTTYAKTKRQLLNLLAHSQASLVTTMLDYYGLAEDFPGKTKLPNGTGRVRVQYLEQELEKAIAHRKFLAYFSLHEFEALLFVAPEIIAKIVPGQDFSKDLTQIKASFSSPEEINDDPETSPSNRLGKLYGKTYNKPILGSLIALEIGLEQIRAECPHFNEWVSKLESLGETSS